jgi:serine/threonine-protein kinase
MFEMLTGERPFEGEIHELLRHHLTTPPPRLAVRRPELAEIPELQELLDRALAKRRDDRFADAGEFLAELERVEKLIDRPRPSSTTALVLANEEPGLREVLRVSGAYAAISMTRFRRRGLPILFSVLRRVGAAFRRARS